MARNPLTAYLVSCIRFRYAVHSRADRTASAPAAGGTARAEGAAADARLGGRTAAALRAGELRVCARPGGAAPRSVSHRASAGRDAGRAPTTGRRGRSARGGGCVSAAVERDRWPDG